MTELLGLPVSELAPSQARRFVADRLAGTPHEELTEVAVLLVTELVTNAVVHAASEVEVEVDPDDTGVTVRVRDADTGPLVLTLQPRDDVGEGGRGFLLVDRLSQSWGTEHRGGRKTVWFRLEARPRDVAALLPAARSAAAAATHRSPVSDPSVASQRLASLLLNDEVERVLDFEHRVAELLDRLLDGVGAHGVELRLDLSPEVVVRRGLAVDSTGTAFSVDLALGDRRLGVLRVGTRDQPAGDDAAFVRLAGSRLTLLAAEHDLLQSEQRRDAKLDFLAQATEMLAGSLNVILTLTLVNQIVVPRLADWCAAYRVDDRGHVHRLTAHHRNEARINSLNVVLDMDQDINRAVRDAGKDGGPQRLPLTVSVGGQRTHVVVLPLVSRSHIVGLLALGRTEPMDAVEFMAAQELARRAALAVDNARLYEEQAAAAEALQASLLPSDLPSLPHLQLAARYHSASPGLSVGGDFYDALRLDDGSVVVAIGDVCGKGAEAAAVTGMTRDVLRLLLREGQDLSGALRRLNHALADRGSGSRFCTVALARLWPGDGTVTARICLAGHPEPVLVTASGGTELVGTPGDLLGVLPDDVLDLAECDVVLSPGDALVFYTDGITERRDEQRMFGQHGLRRALSRAAPNDAEGLAYALEQAARSFVDAPLRDDLAVLVVRYPPVELSGRASASNPSPS